MHIKAAVKLGRHRADC